MPLFAVNGLTISKYDAEHGNIAVTVEERIFSVSLDAESWQDARNQAIGASGMLGVFKGFLNQTWESGSAVDVEVGGIFTLFRLHDSDGKFLGITVQLVMGTDILRLGFHIDSGLLMPHKNPGLEAYNFPAVDLSFAAVDEFVKVLYTFRTASSL